MDFSKCWNNAENLTLLNKSFDVINMICGLSMTHSHTSKITKWPHILVIPLVGPPKPRTKSKNSPTHPGTEKSEVKVVILGNFRGGLKVLICSFQTWAFGYEEIYTLSKVSKLKVQKSICEIWHLWKCKKL